MHYVYLIRSEYYQHQTYISLTDEIEKRLKSHKSGTNKHTAKFRPWKLVSYTAFDTREKAAAFEKYLKQVSGHAFAKRHLW